MRVRHLAVLSVVVLTLSVMGTSAFAVVELVEVSTKTKDATTITWDSGFQDLDYTLGDTITLSVTWTVDAGAAEFSGVIWKRCTPRSRWDPATGGLLTVTLVDDSLVDGEGEVEVELEFTGLHLDRRRAVEIGNAHLKLVLNIDRDGDGIPESLAGYGVNIHVEDPQ